MNNKEFQAETEVQQSKIAELLPLAPLVANPMLEEVKSFSCLYKGNERCSYECAYCERLRW